MGERRPRRRALATGIVRWRAVVVALAVVVAVAWLGAQAFWLEPASLVVHPVDVRLARWSGPPLRVALLSDLHVGSPFNGLDRLDDVIARTNAQQPDVVLIAGDLVVTSLLGGRRVPPEPIAERLARLRAPLGVRTVLGNHDHWFDGHRVKHALEAVGLDPMEDEAVRLRDAAPFWLVGISDLWTARHDWRRGLAEVTDDAPVLAFTHNPDVFPELPSRVDLLLAGHTHGGQVLLPLLGRPIVPSRFGARYAAGLVDERGHRLFVTTGIGTSRLPVRWHVPPEIALLTVHG